MKWNEIIATAIAVTIGMLLANLIASRVPALSSYDTYDASYDGTAMYDDDGEPC